MKLHDIGDALSFGEAPEKARGALILLHGRGGSAEEMAALGEALGTEGLSFLALQAAAHTWYPQRFFAPLEKNEPWLSSGLALIGEAVKQFKGRGIPPERIGLAGFSQGACLSLEYLYRHPQKLGLVAGLSGSLVGPLKTARKRVDLQSTPVLLACAEEDEFIPLPHVEESDVILSAAGADLTKIIFPGSVHSLFPEEIDWMREKLSGWR